MQKTKTISEFLNLTQEEYWNMYLTRYMKWIETHALVGKGDDIDFQKLLANTTINRYYTHHHKDLEQQAFEVLRRVEGFVPLKNKKLLYEAIMVDINQYYPKPLFDAARKLSVNGNQN